MRIILMAGLAVVAVPGLSAAQLAPQDQAEFEQRFTNWTLLDRGSDCNDGNGIDPVTFIGPGRFETGGFEGGYEYAGTGANAGTLTLTADILPIPQATALMFDSRTTGTFAVSAPALAVSCDGSFALVDWSTRPPSFVSAVVGNSGDQITLEFDQSIDNTVPLWLLQDAVSVTAAGGRVDFEGSFPASTTLSLLQLFPVITRGQTVVVAYTDPTPGDDEHAIQGWSGNDAASFIETAINNSTVAPVPALPPAAVGLLGLLLACLSGRLRRRRG